MFELFIKDLEFYGYHGVSDAERELGHRYVLNLNLLVDGSADGTDNLEDTVDYGVVAELAVRRLTEHQFVTLERAASALAELMLARFERVFEAKVSLAKKAPPIPFTASEAGASVTKRRP